MNGPQDKLILTFLGTDIGFISVVRYALETTVQASGNLRGMSDDDEMRIIGMSEEEYKTLTGGSLDAMLAYHRGFHPTIIEEFSKIKDKELDLPSTFWEETRFPIQHGLHRYEAHFTQHTIQIDKTLVQSGRLPASQNA